MAELSKVKTTPAGEAVSRWRAGVFGWVGKGKGGDYRPAASAALQQRHQRAAAVELDQVIAAADVRVADEDLRHGAPLGDVHHRDPGLRIAVDANFLDLFDALGFENLLRANAVGADGGGVHLDGLHRAHVD